MASRTLRLVAFASLLSVAIAAVPATARSQDDAPAEYLTAIDADEAARVLEAVRSEQAKLANGEDAYFDLYSGAPASYAQSSVSPRDTFLNLDFSDVYHIRRESPPGEPVQRYEITIIPDVPDSPVWEIEVLIGWANRKAPVERITIFYTLPPPF